MDRTKLRPNRKKASGYWLRGGEVPPVYVWASSRGRNRSQTTGDNISETSSGCPKMSTKNEDESAKIRLSRQYLKNEADDREEAR